MTRMDSVNTIDLNPVDINDDIVRLILEQLFQLLEYSADTGTQRCHLLLLSRHVRQWLQPLLYRHLDVFLNTDISAILENTSREMLQNTQSVFIKSVAHHEYIPTLLEICCNTKQLAAWYTVRSSNWQSIFQTEHPNLERLSICCGSTTTAFSLTQPLFRLLTHLDLDLSFAPRAYLIGLKSLERLVCLGINVEPEDPMRTAEMIISDPPPSLHLALIFMAKVPEGLDCTWLVEKCDDRIAFNVAKQECIPKPLDGLLVNRPITEADWRPSGELDIWDLGMATLEKRKALKVATNGQGEASLPAAIDLA